MAALIDTSVLIEAERGRLDLEAFTAQRADEEFCLSVITASELLHGVHRAATPAQQSVRSAFVEGILEGFPILPIDLATARTHSRIWAQLAAEGKLLEAHDLWLAATCIAHGYVMISANARDFERVPGLTLEVWA
jgi:tRNA(fMet)-specific endonuclease VapC